MQATWAVCIQRGLPAGNVGCLHTTELPAGNGAACRQCGFGFRPCAEVGFVFRPFAEFGFVLRPSGAIFSLQMDKTRTHICFPSTDGRKPNPGFLGRTEGTPGSLQTDGRCTRIAADGRSANSGCCKRTERKPRPAPDGRRATPRLQGGHDAHARDRRRQASPCGISSARWHSSQTP